MGVAWVARGNIQQISYIPQTEQDSPFRFMLLSLRNVTIIILCYPNASFERGLFAMECDGHF